MKSAGSACSVHAVLRRSWFFLAVCLCLFACARSRPVNPLAPAPVPVSAGPAAVSDAGTHLTQAAVSRDGGVNATGTRSVSTPIANSKWVSLESWLNVHEITVRDSYLNNLESYGCIAVSVGVPPRDGLLCRGGSGAEGSQRDGFDVFVAIIAVADQGRLRTVLRVPHAAGPEDLLDDTPREVVNYINLDVAVESEGRVVTVTERPGAKCAKRLADPDAIGPYRVVVTRACSGRGRYEWKKGRFVRVAPACRKTRPTGKGPVSAVCGGSARACERPDYAADCSGDARASILAMGSFTGPYSEALVILDMPDQIFGASGGTVLVRKTSTGWLPIGYLENLTPKACTKRRGSDGLDRLVCVQNDGAGGSTLVTSVYVLDFSNERYDSIITAFCGQGDKVTSATWSGRANSFDIEVTLLRGVQHDNNIGACEGLRPNSENCETFVLLGA